MRWFFVYSNRVKFKRPKRAPVALALTVLALVCGLRLFNPDFLERLERMTYDVRVRAAQKFPAPAATNLAFVSMEDSSIAAIRHGLLGRPYGLYWPRHVYGRVVEELSAQGAKAIAFDVLFGELRPDHAPVNLADGGIIESDDFFALQMRRAGNVISAFTPEVAPPDLFATNSLALGDISTEKDSDGVLRRVKSFNLKWHPAFKSAVPATRGLIWTNARIEPDKIVLPLPDGTNFTVALDRDGNFDLADFVGDEIPARLAAPCQALHARLGFGHRHGRAGIETGFGPRRGGFAARENYFARRRTASSARFRWTPKVIFTSTGS